MNFSFYSGAVGAQSMQDRMNVIANNIANLNTEGYKTKNGTFSDLVYSQMGSGPVSYTHLDVYKRQIYTL